MRLVILAVLLVANTASADVAAMIGGGVSRVDTGNDGAFTASLDAFLGAKLDAHWSLGGRLQTSWPVHTSELFYVGGGGDSDVSDYKLEGIDIGVSARYEDNNLWLAPWIGEHVASVKDHEYGQAVGDAFDSTTTYNAYAFEVGLTAGVDLYVSGSDRVSIYVDYHHSISQASSESAIQGWSAATFGLAYRR